MIKTEEKNLVSTQSSNFNNYRKEVLEVLEHLKKIKTKKLKESDVSAYLTFVKNNARFNINNYIGNFEKAAKKTSFIQAFEGMTLESLRKTKIKLTSPVIEFNFQKGYPILLTPTKNAFDDDGFRNNAQMLLTGRPEYLIKNLRLKEINYRLSPSDYTANARFVLESFSMDEEEFLKLFYKTLDNYRKRLIEEWISSLQSDYASLMERPRLESFDYRIKSLQIIQKFLGIKLFEWDWAKLN